MLKVGSEVKEQVFSPDALTTGSKGHRHRGPCYLEGGCQKQPSPPPLAAFWPINCILHRSPSQNQTAVHHRQNSLMGKKATLPCGHGSCFPLRESTTWTSQLFYLSLPALKTTCPLIEKNGFTIDEGQKENKGLHKDVKRFKTSPSSVFQRH